MWVGFGRAGEDGENRAMMKRRMKVEQKPAWIFQSTASEEPFPILPTISP